MLVVADELLPYKIVWVDESGETITQQLAPEEAQRIGLLSYGIDPDALTPDALDLDDEDDD